MNISYLVLGIVAAGLAAYLLYAKRLFGLRGGHVAEEARKRELSGWAALEATTPVVQSTSVG